MSDSGLPQFPTRGASMAPASISPLKAEVKVQVIDATGKLARIDTPRQVIGEVSALNKDGTVQVRTPEGELTVRPRERVYPAEGQKIQLDLAPGAPPRQATLRPAPVETAPPPPSTSSSAPATAPRAGSEVVVPPPAADKPVIKPTLEQTTQADLTRRQETQYQARSVPLSPPPTTPQKLPEDAIVRLTPLPPAQAKQLVDQIIQTLQTRLTQAAFMSSQAVQASMTQELRNLIPALPPARVEDIVQNLMPRNGGSSPPAGQPGSPPDAAGIKTPLTQLSQILNGGLMQQDMGATALTPAQGRSTVENFMRQVLTQGSVPAGSSTPTASSSLSTQIMNPPANMMGAAASSATSSVPRAAFTTSLEGLARGAVPAPSALIATVPLTDHTSNPIPSALKVQGFFDGRVQNITPPLAQLQAVGAPASPMLTIKVDMASLITQGTATPAQLQAQVITMTPQHYPVISVLLPGASGGQALTPQLFTLQFPATNLMPGASLTIMPQAGAMPALPAHPPTPMELLGGFQWPAFDEFADLDLMLAGALPGAAGSTQNIAQMLPNPAQPGKLPAAALLFIAAAKAGDINAWLGEKNVESLRRMGKAEFVARMAREFSGLQKLSAEPVNAEWRGVAFPLYSEGQLDKVHLYYRHSPHGEEQDQERAEKGKGTRFIMDLNLSHMGPVQLDGYTRGKQVDLIVRTQKPFGTGARYEMTQRYIRALEAAGFEGALIFQAQPEKFVNIAVRADLLRQSV